jgi:hypothetical protein
MTIEAQAERTRPRTKPIMVYRCPAHGLIESPTWYEDVPAEDSCFYCPINLTNKAEAPHTGITDEVCGKTVHGPRKVQFLD